MNTLILLPIAIFLLVLVGVSAFVQHRQTAGSFTGQYFLGGRSLQGFVLAMTLVATYGSVSSFVSGPGVAWNLGLGWVVFAAPQIIAGFLILGVAGKKMALVSRVTGAITVIDILRARFGNSRTARFLSVLCALLMLVFFTTMMVGQFIGGAQIFAKAAGIDYTYGLLLFGVVTVLYTTFGGFKAVAITDTICAVLMLIGMFALGAAVLDAGGSLANIMNNVTQTVPRDAASAGSLLSPTAGGALGIPLLLSAWILVGFGTLGLPQSAVRCMSYRRSSDLNRAMVISTVVCGALMIGMTTLGVLVRGVMPMPVQTYGSTDGVIPYFIAHYMNPVTAGVTLVGPLAATMSTVSSLLLAACSAVIKDIILFYRPQVENNPVRLKRVTRSLTGVLGIVALLFAVHPLDIIAWINMFAFGGLELAFLLPLIGGLFWSRANAVGALSSVIVGIGVYLLVSIAKLNVGGFHAIVPSMAAGMIAFVAVSLATRPTPARALSIFFPQR